MMRKADIALALFLMLIGFIVLADTLTLGFGWGMSGPEAGFFPFYLSLGTIVCTFIILIRAVKAYRKETPGTAIPLIAEGGLTPILWVLIPAIGMVLLTELIGLHLATILYLLFNMRVMEKTQWVKTILICLLVPMSIYIAFDKIFLIPLPEGLWGKYLIPF
jgi:putative tricarboxylic transport membrane protein